MHCQLNSPYDTSRCLAMKKRRKKKYIGETIYICYANIWRRIVNKKLYISKWMKYFLAYGIIFLRNPLHEPLLHNCTFIAVAWIISLFFSSFIFLKSNDSINLTLRLIHAFTHNRFDVWYIWNEFDSFGC